MKTKWISVTEFANKVGKERTRIYHDIKWGRIPADAWAKIEVKKVAYMIREDYTPVDKK